MKKQSKKITEKQNFINLSKVIIKEDILIKLRRELAFYEDHEGHYTRQNYTEPYWLGYVKALKDIMEIIRKE